MAAKGTIAKEKIIAAMAQLEGYVGTADNGKKVVFQTKDGENGIVNIVVSFTCPKTTPNLDRGNGVEGVKKANDIINDKSAYPTTDEVMELMKRMGLV